MVSLLARIHCIIVMIRWTGLARWSTTLSSKVNSPHAINFGALCGANMVT